MNSEVFHLLTKEYSLLLATTQKEFQSVKALRAEVFAPKFHTSQTELASKDFLWNSDDEQSFIYLLQHNATGKLVGTVRVFFINPSTPVQKLSLEKDAHVNTVEEGLQKRPIGEISRLALSSNLPVYQDFSALKLSMHLSLALMIATRINFFLYHYSTVFSLIEPSLDRLLRRQKVHFEPIGSPVEYYGTRTPYAIERKKLLQETESSMGKVTRYYLQTLCSNPQKFWHFIDNHPYLKRSDIHIEKICHLFKIDGDDAKLSLLL